MSIPGSHLEKLYHLRKRIEDEIRMEERRAGKRAAERVGHVKQKRAPSSVPTVEQRAAAAGTSAKEVRAWAVAQGLLQEGRPGRLPSRLLTAFLAARDSAPETLTAEDVAS